MTCVLGHSQHSVYQMTLIVPTQVSRCLSCGSHENAATSLNLVSEQTLVVSLLCILFTNGPWGADM